MTSKLTTMQEEALALLTNAPSSFAALFRTTTLWVPTLAGTDVGTALAELRSLGDSGLVEFALMLPDGAYREVRPSDFPTVLARYAAWLDGREPGSIPVGETAWDEVGLWIQITMEGQKVYQTLDDEYVIREKSGTKKAF